MLFLYDLPNWLLGVVVVGVAVAGGYAVYFVSHRLFKPQFTEENRGVALAVIGVIATINSLLLAFSAVSVWESFSAADSAVGQEANTVSALARDLAVYDTPVSRQAREMLRDYAQSVVKEEWPEMSHGDASVDVWNKFDRMFKVIGTIDPDTPRHVAQLPEIFARTNELLKQRRSRLYTSESEIPGTLWSVVLIGTILTMALAVVLAPSRFHVAMVGALSMSFGLVFFFIVAMDRPFAGKESISPQPFDIAVGNMERWDKVIAGLEVN